MHVARFVVLRGAALHSVAHQRGVDRARCLSPRCRRSCKFERIERRPRVAVGKRDQEPRASSSRRKSLRSRDRVSHRSSARSTIVPTSSSLERLQYEDASPREERRVHFKRRILRRCADERYRPILDVGQYCVLLRFVEAMDFVDEEHGSPADALRAPASRTTRRKSATPALTADIPSKCAPVVAATICASVVFPLPGGPHRIIDGTASRSIAAAQRCPAPSSVSCPTNSSSVRGRILAASGIAGRAKSRSCRSSDHGAALEIGLRYRILWNVKRSSAWRACDAARPGIAW